MDWEPVEADGTKFDMDIDDWDGAKKKNHGIEKKIYNFLIFYPNFYNFPIFKMNFFQVGAN